MSEVTLYPTSVNPDLRGAHVKLYGKTPEKIHVPDFTVSEVFMTVNHVGVLRGMHFQTNPAQPKLLSCVSGNALVNVVNLDPSSSNFRLVDTFELDGNTESFIHVPAGHALGYLTRSDNTKMLYLAGSDFSPEGDLGVDPFDPVLGLNWGGATVRDVTISERDMALPTLAEFLRYDQVTGTFLDNGETDT